MGSSLLYISIAYYMQKGGGWVQIACEIAYVLNGRSLTVKSMMSQTDSQIEVSGGVRTSSEVQCYFSIRKS